MQREQEMSQGPRKPELSEKKGLQRHAVPYPHFTNLGAEVSGKVKGTSDPGRRVPAWRPVSFLHPSPGPWVLQVPLPSRDSAPRFAPAEPSPSQTGCGALQASVCRREGGALVFIESVEERKPASTCLRTVLSRQVRWLRKMLHCLSWNPLPPAGHSQA